MDRAEHPVVLYKRWRLREGVRLDHVARLVSERVVPHYGKLCEAAVLGLEALDEKTVLAIQRWPDRPTLEQTTNGGRFERWWREYRPILAEWDAALELEDEWVSEVLIG